ncbi:MAG: hypothetical protein GX764_04135 [Firmicutes bacterium]|jgi:predicted RNase H-related nuclease YkuK (DUF458 family)|nr:hypothetical protein [Bacillota bacterium]
MDFYSPTKGKLSFNETYLDLIDYVNQEPHAQWKLIIGSDSQTHLNKEVTFVTAIIIHRVGKGGRYYFHKQKHRFMESLRQRIYYETYLSLEVASKLTAKLAGNGYDDELNIEIHLDVGEKGETRGIIKEVVGMVIGSGYSARIKPESYGAMKVADKYTK